MVRSAAGKRENTIIEQILYKFYVFERIIENLASDVLEIIKKYIITTTKASIECVGDVSSFCIKIKLIEYIVKVNWHCFKKGNNVLFLYREERVVLIQVRMLSMWLKYRFNMMGVRD